MAERAPLPEEPDDLTSSVVWLIHLNGWRVHLDREGETHVAVASKGGVTYVVRGDDPYTAVCVLALKLGIRLKG